MLSYSNYHTCRSTSWEELVLSYLILISSINWEKCLYHIHSLHWWISQGEYWWHCVPRLRQNITNITPEISHATFQWWPLWWPLLWLLKAWICLACFWTLYKWNLMVYIILCLASFIHSRIDLWNPLMLLHIMVNFWFSVLYNTLLCECTTVYSLRGSQFFFHYYK